jgi:hypothetical protein
MTVTATATGRPREKNGKTRIDTLRETYGDDFAAGLRGDAYLRTLLDRTGSSSLSDYLRNKNKRRLKSQLPFDIPTLRPITELRRQWLAWGGAYRHSGTVLNRYPGVTGGLNHL